MARLAGNACIFVTLSVLGWASTVSSKEPSCHRCGCADVIRECRPVVTTKLVTDDYWDRGTQSFCIPHIQGIWPPGHGHAAGHHGKDEKPAKADADALHHHAASRYGAKSRCRNRLIRKKCVREVPVIGWVTEYACPQCGQKTDRGNQAAKGEPPAGKPPAELHPQPAIPIPSSTPPSSKRRNAREIDSPKYTAAGSRFSP